MTEGSGASAKYYIQLGADTASKKALGNANFNIEITARAFVQTRSNNFIQSGSEITIVQTYTYKDGELTFSEVTNQSNFNATASDLRTNVVIKDVKIILL